MYPQHIKLDSIYPLQTIDVSTPRLNWTQNGKRILIFDSLLMQNYQFQDLGSLLGSNSGVFIKSYGHGGLSTTSMRGGNASQTALLWNGFTLNHPMLGQTDFSQIPIFLFDELQIEHGGSSSLNGSGAVNGSIHLTNKSDFDSTLKISLSGAAGSFKARKLGANVHYGNSRFYSHSRFYHQQAKNNFSFLNDSNREERRTHNAIFSTHLVQDLGWKINAKNKITSSLWHSNYSRQLPKSSGALKESQASQYDENTRASIAWKNSGAVHQLTLRTAWLRDVLNYTDSLLPLFSKSETRSFITEMEAQWQVYKRLEVLFGFQFSHQNVNTNNYNAIKTVSKASLLGGLQWHNWMHTFNISATLRQEQNNILKIPPTGQLAFEVKPCRQLQLKANLAKVFRMPTLNDWFWNPGGNPNLKPEQGYTGDGTAEWQYHFGAFHLEVLGSVFYKTIDNWILWLPAANGITSPRNILQVTSRGAETQSALKYQLKSGFIKLQAQTSYVLSTVTKSDLKNDASEGMQLIYTPRYQVNGNFIVGGKNWSLLYNHQYVGYRFTSSDNLNWIMPYYIGSLKASYTLPIKNLNINFFGSIMNLWNADYEVLLNQPMALRQYEFGMRLQRNYKLK
jgi:vitamin B12 transporter